MPTGTQPLPSPLSQHVGSLLSEAIRFRGLAQSAVAETAGLSSSQLSRALAGKKVFTLDQLDAVCSVVGVDMIDIIATADEATRDRPQPRSGELITGRFGGEPVADNELKVARRKSSDRGGDDGQG